MFIDCDANKSAELFIVEGRSAANAVNRVRNRQQQAVFALQGKIPNCSSENGLQRALKNQHVKSLMTVIQSERFSTLLILCDADADGLHARHLLSTFFQTHLPELIRRRLVFHVYPPLYQWRERLNGTLRYGWMRQSVDCHFDGSCDTVYFKGVASMSAQSLASTCVNVDSRATHLISAVGDARD